MSDGAVSPCRKVCKWLSWSIGMGTFLFECAAVAWVCRNYWRAFVIYFALSAAFVLVPAVLTTVKSLLWLHSYDMQRIRRRGNCLKRLNAVSIFLHFVSLGFVYRYITLVRLSIIGEQDINLFEADTVAVRFLHTFLSSAPQIALQLSFIIAFPTEPAAKIAAVVIAASVLSLIYGLVTFAGSDYLRTRDHHLIRLAHQLPTHQLPPVAHVVQASWHICMVASRVLAFALFSYAYGAVVFVVVAGHWTSMFCMLVVSRMVCNPRQPGSTESKKRWFSELPFESVASFGYVFVFFRLKHNCVCSRVGVGHLVVFHLLTWLENITMVMLFFMQKRDLWYALGSLPLVIGLPLMGVLLFLLYHTVLNPAKTWHCVGVSSCGRSSCSNSIDTSVPTQDAGGVVSSVSVDTFGILPKTNSISPEVGSSLPEAIGTTQHPGPSSSVSGPQSTLPTSTSELSSHNTSPEMMESTRHSVSPIEATGPFDPTVKPSEEDTVTNVQATPDARHVPQSIPRSTQGCTTTSHQPLHTRQIVSCTKITEKLPIVFPCAHKMDFIAAKLVPGPNQGTNGNASTEIAPSLCQVQSSLSQGHNGCIKNTSADATRARQTQPVAKIPVRIIGNKMDTEVIPVTLKVDSWTIPTLVHPEKREEINCFKYSHTTTTFPQDQVQSAQRTSVSAQISPRSHENSTRSTLGVHLQPDRWLPCSNRYAVPSIHWCNARSGVHSSRLACTPQTRSVPLPRSDTGDWRNSATSSHMSSHVGRSHGAAHKYSSNGKTNLMTMPQATPTTATPRAQTPFKSQTTPKGLVVPNQFAVLNIQTTPGVPNSSKSSSMLHAPTSSPHHIFPSLHHTPPIAPLSPYHRGSSHQRSPHHHGLTPRTAQVPRPISLGHSLLGDDDVDMPLWVEERTHTTPVFRIPPQNASTSEV